MAKHKIEIIIIFLKTSKAECLWLTPTILTTWEAEVGRICGSRPVRQGV
jgi:hypothetical protein